MRVLPALALVVLSPLASAQEREIPVVVDTPGVPPSHFRSDLLLTNRGGVPARVALGFRLQSGMPIPPEVVETVPAYRETRVEDLVSYLRERGVSLPAAGQSVVGSLRVRVLEGDPALVHVGSRIATPNPGSAGGTYGLFTPSLALTAGTAGTVSVYGLREDPTFRSNLAFVDVPTGSGPASLAVTLVDGDTGLAAGAPLQIALAPGELRQIGSVLSQRGLSNGYAIVTRAGGGTDPVLVYGVLNDGGAASSGGTSDGSYLFPDPGPGLLPIVLHVKAGEVVYSSELILANPEPRDVVATLTYTPAASLAPGDAVHATIPIPAGRQLRIPDVVRHLASLGLSIPGGEAQGGTLLVEGAAALVRTSNPNPDTAVGGTFGVSYGAFSRASRATRSAVVPGLRQDALFRTNLAIADARVGDGAGVDYEVDLHDARSGSGAAARTLGPFTLSGGQWLQLSAVLSGTGLTSGWAVVRTRGGVASDFVAYAVVNDGAAPGQGTSDGSFLGVVPDASPAVDCTAGACATVLPSGEAPHEIPGVGPGPFRGTGDPSIRRDPATGVLWMGYSWPSTQIVPPQRLSSVSSLHLARSEDAGATWRLVGSLFSSTPEIDPGGSGTPGFSSHEVISLSPRTTPAGTLWYGARLRYFVPEGGGILGRRSDSFHFRVAVASSPEALATAPEARLGGALTARGWNVDTNLSALSPEVAHCHVWNEPALHVEGDELRLAAVCLAYDPATGKRVEDRELVAVFSTRPEGEPRAWSWRYLGALTRHAEATALGGENLTEVDLVRSRDGRLLTVLTPNYFDATLGADIHLGCRFLEVVSLDPPRLARTPSGELALRATVDAPDLVTYGPAGCGYDPASATGVVFVRRLFDFGKPELVWSFHATGLHP